MNCARCGCRSPERAKFRLECGAAFAARWAGCGRELPPSVAEGADGIRRWKRLNLAE
jgi:hypothetical protein